jgi:hypothetical protein
MWMPVASDGGRVCRRERKCLPQRLLPTSAVSRGVSPFPAVRCIDGVDLLDRAAVVAVAAQDRGLPTTEVSASHPLHRLVP